MFKDIQDYPNDPIEALFTRLEDDTDPDKIDLGIGVFRDDAGKVPVMQAVRKAEERLVAKDLPKSYISPLGNSDYCRDVERLVLGADHPATSPGRIVSAQTPGAGGALRAGAEFVSSLSAESVVWVSDLVWEHQLGFFEQAGLKLRRYRYYDQFNSILLFDGMMEDLRAMQPDDILLLHGCCHNPTGQDLNLDQWSIVADVVVETGAIPFVDVAYQGFGTGIDADVAGLRLLAGIVPQMLLTVSSSKSFGIYRERAGLLSIVLPADGSDFESVRRKLRDTVRDLYFMAPDHGAAIVHEILSTPELEVLWRKELDGIRQHVTRKRQALRVAIEKANPGLDAGFLESQRGMFSCLPIAADEQLFIEQSHHIYMFPNARVNVAAMSEAQAIILANAFADVRARRVSSATEGQLASA